MLKSNNRCLSIFLFAVTIFVCLHAKAQIRIGSNEDFFPSPQKGDKVYTTYWYPFSDYMLKHLHIYEKTITEKGVVENGLVKKVFCFEGAKQISTETNFYKDSLLVKFIKTYPKSRYNETFVYRYDPLTKEMIFAKGTQNSKLIYSVIKTRLKDSIIEKRIYNDELLKVKERRITYFSPDSLTETRLLCSKGQKVSKNTKIYITKNIIAEEIDSSENYERKEKYIYDTLGRLSEKRGYEKLVFDYVTEYKYEDYKTTVSSYPLYKGKKEEISKEHLKLYDKSGLLVFEKTTEYDKPEGIVAPPGSKQIMVEPTVEPGLIILKSYHQNRLIEVQINHGDEVGNCYEIQYR